MAFNAGDTVRHATENLPAEVLSRHASTRGSGKPGPVFYLVKFLAGHLANRTLLIIEDALVPA
ncbi:hypothetical protein M1D80_09605 [Phyllobacteriaceae bacterium JZ32]